MVAHKLVNTAVIWGVDDQGHVVSLSLPFSVVMLLLMLVPMPVLIFGDDGDKQWGC